MRKLPAIALVVAVMQAAAPLSCQTLPSLASPSHVVRISGLRVAEMSPDEEYLAAFVVHGPKGASATAELEVWDFRGGGLLRARSLRVPALRPGFMPSLRFTSDSQLLTAYAGGDLLHVLRFSDLEEVRTIQIPPTANPTAFEVSPTDHRLAVRLAGDACAVRLYDLDSGKEIQSWTINKYPEFRWPELLKVSPQLDGSGLAWQADGAALAISVADNPRCMRGGGTIYILDPASPRMRTFRIPLLPASIAFGAGNALYVASDTCGGYFSHWVLDLPILDAASGKETGRLPAGKTGIRRRISISANRQFLLGFADRERTTFEGFEDTLKVEDAQWQVWDLKARRMILTLPADAHVGPCNYNLISGSGRFLYGSDMEQVCLFSLRP